MIPWFPTIRLAGSAAALSLLVGPALGVEMTSPVGGERVSSEELTISYGGELPTDSSYLTLVINGGETDDSSFSEKRPFRIVGGRTYLWPVADSWYGPRSLAPGAFTQLSLDPGAQYTVALRTVKYGACATGGFCYTKVAETPPVTVEYVGFKPVLIYNRISAQKTIMEGFEGERGLGPKANRGGIQPGGTGGRLSGVRLAKDLRLDDTEDSVAYLTKQLVPNKYSAPWPGCVPVPVVVDEITPAFAGATGAELTRVMSQLGQTEQGCSIASRLHFYIAGGVLQDIASGKSAQYRGLRGALRMAGGVWLEMYSGSASGRAKSFTSQDWRTVPAKFAAFVGGTSNLHFVMTEETGVPRVGDCTGAMNCLWALAGSTATNRQILANRPGTYRVRSQARDWLLEYNKRWSD